MFEVCQKFKTTMYRLDQAMCSYNNVQNKNGHGIFFQKYPIDYIWKVYDVTND